MLLLFLRHFGCSFCRETLDRVSQIRGKLEAKGVRPVFVHLGTPERAKPYFDYYNLSDVERVSNPDATLVSESSRSGWGGRILSATSFGRRW